MNAPIVWSGYGRQLRPPLESLEFPMLHFDMEREIDRLRGEQVYADLGRNGKTLVKHHALRVVASVLARGHRIPLHRVHGPAMIQVLDGRLRVHLARRTLEVSGGQVLALEHDVPFDLQAMEDSAYLTTLAMAGKARRERPCPLCAGCEHCQATLKARAH